MREERGGAHPPEERLQAWADGTLPDHARRALEGHLDGCPACRADAEGLRALVEDLGTLPAGIAPERDLLPEIEAAIDARTRSATPREALRAVRRPLAAAALVLVAVTALVTAALLDRLPPGGEGRIGDAGGPARTAARAGDGADGGVEYASYRVVESEYARAARELARTLEARRSELSPETVRLVEENLRVIDRALAEAREALAADPGNPALREIVVAAHEWKLELLRRATRVAGEGGET